MEISFELTQQMAIAVMAGIAAQVLAEYLRIPSIVFLLLLGIALGGNGLELLHPHQLGVGLDVLVSLSVAVILFEGGFSLQLGDLMKVSGSLRNLVTIGTLISLVGGAIAAHWLAEFPWKIAFLYSSLVVVTGPTVIGPLLKQVKVDKEVATLLEGEGVLIDPVGAILAVVVLNFILNGETDPAIAISGLFLRLSIGGAIGALGGWLLGLILKEAKFLSEDLQNLVVLAGLWSLYLLSQTIQSESGLMTTVIMGIVLKASSVPEARKLKRFKGQLTILAVSVLFILLSADLSIPSVFALGWGSVLAVLCLMLIVRPLNIWLCTFNSTLNFRQKLFLAWIAPKGIVSASVASLFALVLTQRGINGGDSIKALVFLTIMMTVFIPGLTARWVAKWLQISLNEATGLVIVGINPISCLIARQFLDAGESVVLIDESRDACQLAEAENLPFFQNNALETSVLEGAGLAKAGTLLVMTNNVAVNLAVAEKAVDEFDPPRVLAILTTEESTNGNNKAKTNKIQQAFINQIPMKTWNKYVSQGDVRLAKTTIKEDSLFQKDYIQAFIKSGELIPILLIRDERLMVMLADDEDQWKPGDELIYLFHLPKTNLSKRLSGQAVKLPLVIETLPTIEEVPITATISMGSLVTTAYQK